MNCQELIDLLHDYIGGELVIEKLRTVELHLTICNKCVMLVKSYQCTIRLARALPKCGQLPAAVEARLRKVLAPHLGEEKDEG